MSCVEIECNRRSLKSLSFFAPTSIKFDYIYRRPVYYGWDMPVTAKLSREFYDKFGDKVIDELVGLLNDMDATFRAELRELNEQNWLRFEAKLEQRIAELETKLMTEIALLRGEFTAKLGGLEVKMSELKAELIKWMFLFWLGTVATMLGFGRFLLTG